MLGIYGVGGKLMEGIKAFYTGASACVRVKGDLTEFPYRRGCETGV